MQANRVQWSFDSPEGGVWQWEKDPASPRFGLMDSFLIALGMVFLAEMGDKTQLVALSLAGRYKTKITLLGIFAATGAVHVLSVVVGAVLGHNLSSSWTTFLAGICFLLFGIWTLRGNNDDGSERRGISPFWIVFWTFLIAELGDKTMFTTATVAAQHSSFWLPVWVGSTIGLVLADALAIGLGVVVGMRLPQLLIRRIAAGIFVVFGIWSVWMGGRELAWHAWVGGGAVLAGGLLILFREGFSKLAKRDLTAR